MSFAEKVKEVLLERIHEMSANAWLFVQNPESDFTRKRKLDFETMLQCLLAMESGSIQKELLEMFRFNPDTATASAFYQQRGKIPITLRIVRFPLSADTYECVITKLPNDEFPPDELKKLYAMRWGIETSFHELKYAIGLSCFHTKKVA